MKTKLALITALLTLLLSGTAFACGDSLYRVGKGMEYRTYSAPLPGRLLVYAGSVEAQHLAKALAESGHHVHIVATEEDLRTELGSGSYEIVIAPYSEREAVEALDDGSSYLPVAMDRDEKSLAKQQYERVLSSDDNLKRFLKTIHKTLKARA